jgi:hypothetical protein
MLAPICDLGFFGKKFEMLMMMMMKCARAHLSLSPRVIWLFRSSVFLSGDILPFFNKEIGKFLEYFCFCSANSTNFAKFFLLKFANFRYQKNEGKKKHCLGSWLNIQFHNLAD